MPYEVSSQCVVCCNDRPQFSESRIVLEGLAIWVLVLFFCEPPVVLHGFVQSGIWHDHFKTTIMKENFELPSYECFLLDVQANKGLGIVY